MKIDVLKGFSVGAVDYLKKPIDEEELVVRIESLLSRLKAAENPQTETPPWAATSMTWATSACFWKGRRSP